jgi:hypothetical protein
MSKANSLARKQPAAVEPIERNDKQKMLEPKRLADPDFGWRTYEATLPADTPLEHVLSGAFWRLCSRRISRGDHIRFRDDFLTRFGELVCVGVDHATGDMEMRLLWSEDVECSNTPNGETIGYSVKDLGVHNGLAIVRDADGHEMARNIRSYSEAMRRIRVEYMPLKSDGSGGGGAGGGKG